MTERATPALLWLAVMLVPAAIAFAYDGVLIGAGDYRFLGLAALGYLAAVAPIGAVMLLYPRGIGGIWAGLAVDGDAGGGQPRPHAARPRTRDGKSRPQRSPVNSTG